MFRVVLARPGQLPLHRLSLIVVKSESESLQDTVRRIVGTVRLSRDGFDAWPLECPVNDGLDGFGHIGAPLMLR